MAQQKVEPAETKASLESGAGNIIPGYSILARVGRGGMGAVFKAVQLSMNRLVALKILPVSLAKDRIYIRRFLREARSAAQMNHTNLTRVYDVGSYRGVFYFSMEFVEGSTLLDLIRSEACLDVETAADIVLQTARGLKHAHSHSIVHRDIKPENIMVATDGTIKLTDMGLAKRTDLADHDITLTGQVIGTPCYMSPEQITNPKAVDHRSDIYSLGATFFHMLTGERPFHGETSAQTMLKAVAEDPHWPRGRVPAPVLRVLKKMMAKDPAQRYLDADELTADLVYLKEKVFPSMRIPRMEPFSSAAAPTPDTRQGGYAPIVEAPSRKFALILGLCALFAVLAAILLNPSVAARPAQPASRGAPQHPERPEPGLSFDDYFGRGMELAGQDRWEDALLYFDSATTVNPDSYDAWNNRGTCLWHMGSHEAAIKSFDRALDLDYQRVDAHLNRGVALLELDRPAEALAEFESAANISPGSHAAWMGKAVALRSLGRMEDAGAAQARADELKH